MFFISQSILGSSEPFKTREKRPFLVAVISFFLSLILMTALLLLLLSCAENSIDDKVDYSEYSFTDILWTRKAEHDIESIR